MLNLNIFFNYNKAFKLEINKVFWYKTINAKFKKKKKLSTIIRHLKLKIIRKSRNVKIHCLQIVCTTTL